MAGALRGAEYSSALLDALPRRGIERLAVICDDRTPAGDAVRPVGRLGDAAHDNILLNAIMHEDADVVVIQHHPGLLAWAALARLLGRLTPQPRAVLVTLHSTRPLQGLMPPERDAVLAALGRVARILVHTVADLDIMQSLGLGPCTALLPHGAAVPLPSRWTADGPLIMGCTGFFLPGKGIGHLIEATAKLRPAWPGLQLRLICAEYGDPISAAEIARCRALAKAVCADVEWHTEFLPSAKAAALLAECRLVVLPHAPSLESLSGSLRSALAAGVPVAVSPLELFDEAADAVARLRGGEPADIAAGIDELLSDPAGLARLQAAGQAWLAARQWPELAGRLHGMMLGFAAQERVERLSDM